MITINRLTGILFLCLFHFCFFISSAQDELKWSADGNSLLFSDESNIVQVSFSPQQQKLLVSPAQLTPQGQSEPLSIDRFDFSDNGNKVLIYTNSKKVWRINTRGDYYVLDRGTGSLTKVGASRPDASLMFAKFSPDASKIAYVSDYNVYVEDLATGKVTALTTDGNRRFINGTFDWVYEEEFACRDGIRWSPDGKSVLFWQIDARGTRDFYMINNTDSIYSQVIPVEYPKAGEQPSASRLGVADIGTGKITWMNVEGNPREHYIVRAEFIPGTTDLLIQQLNRKQNVSKIIRGNSLTGATATIYREEDPAWIDVYTQFSSTDSYALDFRHKYNWIQGGKEFLWESEKDGWNHLYRISIDGKKQQLVTSGAYDVISYQAVDEQKGFLYYTASPTNATQKYLYRTRLDGKGKPEQVTPAGMPGTHAYEFSPNARIASHSFSNANTEPAFEMVSLPDHKPLDSKQKITYQWTNTSAQESSVEFFKVKTIDGVEMDGWMMKPKNFDPAKKYPVVFYVYGEPGSVEVLDEWGNGRNYMYEGDMSADGYVYISLDNRGTPAPKGREFRKSIYRKIGQLNTRDQAMGAKEVLKWDFIDKDRVAVWGWSGGGTSTLNLMFQYPEIFKTGIAVSAITNLLTYDNIYQERYMGLPQETMQDYIKGSPVTYAKNLQGKLLYIHGTGDDNVHFQNAELLINELIRNNKIFQLMIYPNRTHNVDEGEGTTKHLHHLYTTFLKENCPPGGR
jgi:dipeptidyl-peptidase 4